jgi:hypothetical protein
MESRAGTRALRTDFLPAVSHATNNAKRMLVGDEESKLSSLVGVAASRFSPYIAFLIFLRSMSGLRLRPLGVCKRLPSQETS